MISNKKMKITKKGIGQTAALATIAGVLALLMVLIPKLQVSDDAKTLGSVTQGNEYFSTTTRQAVTGVELTNLTVLKNTSGGFGSVIITGAGSGIMNFYDATTSNASLRTKAATTSLAVFPASAAAGTYTFDVVFSDGLLFEEVGAVASSTITWR